MFTKATSQTLPTSNSHEQNIITNYIPPTGTKNIVIEYSFFISSVSSTNGIIDSDIIAECSLFIGTNELKLSKEMIHFDLVEGYATISTIINITGTETNMDINELKDWTTNQNIKLKITLKSNESIKINYSKYSNDVHGVDIKSPNLKLICIGERTDANKYTKNQLLEYLSSNYNGYLNYTDNSVYNIYDVVSETTIPSNLEPVQYDIISNYIPPTNAKQIIIEYSFFITSNNNNNNDGIIDSDIIAECSLNIDDDELRLTRQFIHFDLVEKYTTLRAIINITGSTDANTFNNELKEWIFSRNIQFYIKLKSTYSIKLHHNSSDFVMKPKIKIITLGEKDYESQRNNYVLTNRIKLLELQNKTLLQRLEALEQAQ